MDAQFRIKQNIKENLPYGALTLIAQSVSLKKNRKVSISHVGNVCNPEKSAWDKDIISTAQKMIIKRQKDLIQALEAII